MTCALVKVERQFHGSDRWHITLASQMLLVSMSVQAVYCCNILSVVYAMHAGIGRSVHAV